MVQEQTLYDVLNDALTTLKTKYGIKARIISDRDKPEAPLKVVLSDPNSKRKNCFLHNISRGVLLVCGNGLPQIIEACYHSWTTSNILKINVCNSVLDAHFNKLISSNPAEFNSLSIKLLSNCARKLANRNAPASIRYATDACKLLAHPDIFDDEESVEYLIARIDNYKGVRSMVSSLGKHKTFFSCDEERKFSMKELIEKGADKRDVRTKIGEALGVHERSVRTLLEIVCECGTPRFIKRYEEYLAQDRANLETLASDEDISSLVGAFQPAK